LESPPANDLHRQRLVKEDGFRFKTLSGIVAMLAATSRRIAGVRAGCQFRLRDDGLSGGRPACGEVAGMVLTSAAFFVRFCWQHPPAAAHRPAT